jgi:hypothetical protein
VGADATGRILGGSGKYAGIAGTIVGEPPQGSSSKVTLTYQLK